MNRIHKSAASRMTALTLIVLSLAGRSVLAAGASQVPRYTPQTPTISPYLSLLNRNSSAASNYFTLVRPQLRQQHINERNVLQSTRQQQELQNLQLQQQQSFEQPNVRPTGTAGWFNQPGQNPSFQQTSHFFGQWQNGPGSSLKRVGR